MIRYSLTVVSEFGLPPGRSAVRAVLEGQTPNAALHAFAGHL
jgi:hypothetical protein